MCSSLKYACMQRGPEVEKCPFVIQFLGNFEILIFFFLNIELVIQLVNDISG